MKLLIALEKILPLAFWVMLIFGFNSPYVSVLTILSAVLHEIGHILFSFALSSGKTSLPAPDIYGFKIKAESLSYKEELVSALGGPAANIIIAAVCYLFAFFGIRGEYIQIFAIINLMTAITNLMPIEEYDGYRILSSALAFFIKDYSTTVRILYCVSFSFSVVMCFLSLYLILQLGDGYWVFIVFFSIVIQHITKRQKYAFFEKK